MTDAVDWTEARIAEIRALWAAGHATAEIGRRMGISKNAVVGKAHRLDLPPRPSPIRQTALGGPDLGAGVPPRSRRTVCSVEQRALAAPPPPILAPEPVKPLSLRPIPCVWPLGEPGTPGFRFCADPTLPGKPYCPAHVAVGYVKVRDRRDDRATSKNRANRREFAESRDGWGRF